ncbi:MAG: NfeD family protein, partial [Thermomicrobiales bacterium]|nr:NfeD family protein [Thermomicrobiales bacterium]
VARPVIWTAAGLVLLSAIGIGMLVVKLQRSAPKTGKKVMIGQIATVRAPLNPSGMVFFDGELWNATLEDEHQSAPAGTNVRIVGITGIRLTVALTDESETNVVADTPRREGLVPVSQYS